LNNYKGDGLMKGPNTATELEFWEKFEGAYKKEVGFINKLLDDLKEVLESIQKHLFHDWNGYEDSISRLPDSSDSNWSTIDLFRSGLKDQNNLQLGVWSSLVTEALERLSASRLLLYTGHLNRSVACIRDSYECLKWADICLCSEKEAKKWLKSKQIKGKKDFEYSKPLSKELFDNSQKLYNIWGTHSYLNAQLLSSVTSMTSDPKYRNEIGVEEQHKQAVLNVLTPILQALWYFTVYVFNISDKYIEHKDYLSTWADDIYDVLVINTVQLFTVSSNLLKLMKDLLNKYKKSS